MQLLQPHHSHSSSSTENRSSFPIPMIYEHIPAKAPVWEYRVVTIEASENELPDAEKLNELGREGWVLVGLLDERANGRGAHVHYYFTRQVQDEQSEK